MPCPLCVPPRPLRLCVEKNHSFAMNPRHLLAFFPLLAGSLLAADAPKLTSAESDFFETRVSV